MALTPALHAVVSNDKSSTKKEELHTDFEEKLAITECRGESQPNLASFISHYVQTLKHRNLRNLGTLSCFYFLSSKCVFIHFNNNISVHDS